MSVIIRLQNLPWTANAMDIRLFFHGLNIPDGGVHIVGGEKGDAFIAFATDEDARQAMLKNGGKLKDNYVQLFLSSKTEMQNVIADARKAPPAPIPIHQPIDQFGIGLSGLPPQNLQPQMFPTGMQPGLMQPSHLMGSLPGFPGQVLPQFQNRFGGPLGPQTDIVPQGHAENGQGRMEDHRMDDRDRTERQDDGSSSDRERRRRRSRDRRSRSRSAQRNRRASRSRDRSRDRSRGHSRERKRGERDRNDRRSQSESRRERNGERKKSPSRPIIRVPYTGPPTHCIFVNKIPNALTYRDIRRFFRGLDIPRDGLKLMYDRDGGRHRNAVVKFFQLDHAQNALKMNGVEMNGSKLEIDMVAEEEFEKAKDTFSPMPKRSPPREPVIHREPLPSQDMGRIVPPFEEQVMPRGPLGPERRGPPPDRFPPPGPRGPRLPLLETPRPDMPHPPHLDQMRNDHMMETEGIQNRPPQHIETTGYCVMVSNLPPGLQRDDLRNFFGEQKLVRGGMYVEYEGKTCLGRAYIEFLREMDIVGALNKNGNILGGYQVEVVPISKEQLEMSKRNHRDIMQQQHVERGNGGRPFMRDSERPQNDGPPPDRPLHRPPHDRPPLDLTPHDRPPQNRHPNDRPPQDRPPHERSPHGRPDRPPQNRPPHDRPDRPPHDRLPHDRPDRPPRDRPLHDRPPHDAGRGDWPLMSPPRGGPPSRGPMRDGSPPHRGPSSEPRRVYNNLPPNPCVRLHGVPFDSTVETILDFFHGIHLKPEQVKILYGRHGEASGIAFVEFNNPMDYQRALERDKEYIGSRYINVTSLKKEDAQREIEDFHSRGPTARQPPPTRNGPPPSGPPNRGPPANTTVYLNNLPYSVTPEEVLEFLRGCGPIPDSLRFREEGGKRTGQAMIMLNHPAAVDKALQQLQGLQIRGRGVQLST